jgi:hypothetical protein
MKQVELSYRKPRDESFQPSCRTNRKASGSVGEDTVQRIVKLYNGGQSIESVTREVGRARHVVVHVLQSRGVFGNRPTEPDLKESRTGAPIVEESKEELVREVLKTEGIDEPTSKSLRKPKSPRKPVARSAEKVNQSLSGTRKRRLPADGLL